jgi:hypothetical protein
MIDSTNGVTQYATPNVLTLFRTKHKWGHALAAVAMTAGFYLLEPGIDPPAVYFNTPISQWIMEQAYDTASQCETARASLKNDAEVRGKTLCTKSKIKSAPFGCSIAEAEHIAHAETHLRLLKEGNQDEDHLSHGATRLLMALCLRAELRPFSG